MVRATAEKSRTELFEYNRTTLRQLKPINTEATDLEICVSGGRVRANVENSFLLDVSGWAQNCQQSTVNSIKTFINQ